MYKLINSIVDGSLNCIRRMSDEALIPIAPDNTDYQNFKKQINADEAQLEDAEGLTLSSAEAQAYVSSLP